MTCLHCFTMKVFVSNFKVEKVKTWTTLSTFFTFFWHDTSKKRKKRILEQCECRIAVVQPREDEKRHQRLNNRSLHWPTDSPQLTQYRVAGRYRFRGVRPHRDITVDAYSEDSNGRSWWNNGRSRSGAMTAAADEDGGLLWTRKTRSSQCSAVTG